MNRLIRILIIAVIVLLFIHPAWYGAEMLIHGVSQRSAVDIFVQVIISLYIATELVKGAELNERKREYAKQFAGELFKHIKEGTEKSGKD